ncbi:putative bifunctional diguanylate cyclase/phosphodiesterase [Domibacillus indicus]|uniref:putative bifunctional diguanylate cyclase/phosphodiesterase n=1 Tax=Domibacillus indicus TaxID=1437523 RepID=UPI000617ED18|nr:EAL domain-containing protein [Domibacillus indicus]
MFTSSVPPAYVELAGHYSWMFVLLSILIACLSSYTALSLNERVRKNGFFHQSVWLVLASLAMGFGIWSMHFIGMSAFSLPVAMHFSHLWTFVSVIPAILASFLAFTLASRSTQSFLSFALSGVAMGVGIASMHYTGMASMVMDAVYRYNIWLFLSSIAIAIVVSFIALYIFSNLKQLMEKRIVKIITALIMGLAISSMHYTGMAAVTFYASPDSILRDHASHTDMTMLIVPVAVGMFFLLGVLLFSSIMDRYIDYRISYFDGLTRLPNRRQFEKMLNKPAASRGLAIWHFHNLEKINNGYGYACGDQVIQRIADELREAHPGFKELYRIEGNRFAFLSEETEPDLFQKAMETIALKWKEPLLLEEKWIELSSVCAVSFSKGADPHHQLYANALAVLEHPLLKYEHDIILYDSTIHTFSFEQEILNGLARAMSEDELFLVYQPKIFADTSRLNGFEALIRWRHPVHGMLSPAVFIPILEQNHRIDDVTDWVIDRAARQISQWEKSGLPGQKIAVNIPGTYITSARLTASLEKAITHHRVDPKQLELEITETSVVQSAESAIRAISSFRKQGFSVALDDFGTGVSSLSFLRQMPITTLKIDKSFVDRVPHSEKDSAILHAIITLGQSLNLNIVIEGVETADQVRFLVTTARSLTVQGYYYARPMTADEIAKWRLDFSETLREDYLFS